jgi:flagellar biosynthesis protein FlhG
MDQAERLRSLVNRHKENQQEKKAEFRVIAITSGKGGVGKTNLTVNLGIHLAKTGKRVVIVDTDFGLANVEVLLGIAPRHTLQEVLSGDISIKEAITQGPEGVMFLSGGSGLTDLADLSEAQIKLLIKGFKELNDMTDILLIDTGAGMSKSVTNFLRASDEIIVVTTSDPTAIADAYAIIKIMTKDNDHFPKLKLVVNRVESHKEGIDVYSRMYRVCNRFLDVKLLNLGMIPYDKYLMRAVKAQEAVSVTYPNSDSSRSIEVICKRLLDVVVAKNFIERWFDFAKK